MRLDGFPRKLRAVTEASVDSKVVKTGTESFGVGTNKVVDSANLAVPFFSVRKIFERSLARNLLPVVTDIC